MTSQNPENFRLPIDYTFSENSLGSFFYKVYDTKLNYVEAKAQCEFDGAFLATPRSQAENDFLTGLLSDNRFWIGINDIEEERNFVAVAILLLKNHSPEAEFVNRKVFQKFHFGCKELSKRQNRDVFAFVSVRLISRSIKDIMLYF